MKIKIIIASLLMGYATPIFGQTSKPASAVPALAAKLKITYPKSNPLKEALQPVPKDAVFKMPGYYLWDPSVIKVGDTYHLFASRWPASAGMAGWKKSQVIRATSTSLFGPYELKELVLSPNNHPWANEGIHNPKIMKAGGRYLIYHLGIPQWKTGFAFADSIEGPWTPVAQPVINLNNPALLVRPDGSAYAVGKFKPTLQGVINYCMKAFTATNYLGPYTVVKDEQNRLPGGFELEDPTVWWANEQYNVICTDMHAKVTGVQKAVVYYTSKNGADYELYSPIPVWSQNDPVPLAGGGEFRVKGVERPQVYLNDQGAVTALLVSVYPEEQIPTYIIIRPVDNFVPEN